MQELIQNSAPPADTLFYLPGFHAEKLMEVRTTKISCQVTTRTSGGGFATGHILYEASHPSMASPCSSPHKTRVRPAAQQEALYIYGVVLRGGVGPEMAWERSTRPQRRNACFDSVRLRCMAGCRHWAKRRRREFDTRRPILWAFELHL